MNALVQRAFILFWIILLECIARRRIIGKYVGVYTVYVYIPPSQLLFYNAELLLKRLIPVYSVKSNIWMYQFLVFW